MQLTTRLASYLALALAATPAAAFPRDAGIQGPRPPVVTHPLTCHDVAQNVLTIQFAPSLGITVDATGRPVARNPAQLSAAQRAELARIRAWADVRWQMEIEPATIEALGRRGANNTEAERALRELAAFARATIGDTTRRRADLRTGTPFDNLPVMSPTLCARTATVLQALSASPIVTSAAVSPVPAPPPAMP